MTGVCCCRWAKQVDEDDVNRAPYARLAELFMQVGCALPFAPLVRHGCLSAIPTSSHPVGRGAPLRPWLPSSCCD